MCNQQYLAWKIKFKTCRKYSRQANQQLIINKKKLSTFRAIQFLKMKVLIKLMPIISALLTTYGWNFATKPQILKFRREKAASGMLNYYIKWWKWTGFGPHRRCPNWDIKPLLFCGRPYHQWYAARKVQCERGEIYVLMLCRTFARIYNELQPSWFGIFH